MEFPDKTELENLCLEGSCNLSWTPAPAFKPFATGEVFLSTGIKPLFQVRLWTCEA
jgi:hypothetical protein